jgi:UDP-N-acetylmuramoyl-L-alanyl-D-glutamate--2,6-diaminopimelate ligase
MKLSMLLKGAGPCTVKGDRNVDINSLSYNSKQAGSNSMFFAIQGCKQNGNNFIDEAITRGAVCVASDQDFITYKNVTKVITCDIRKMCAITAANFYQHPAEAMNVIGITGTNGKTTVLYMVSNILRHAGIKCGTIGTVSYNIGSRLIPACNTTPSPIMLQMLLNDMRSCDISNSVMEVSSHALDQDRVCGILFNRAVFTNITPEHLDYHKNMEEYFNAKQKLFFMLKDNGMAIVNIDNEYGRRIAGTLRKDRVLTYGIHEKADIKACDIKKTACSTNFTVHTPDKPFLVNSRFIGRHNVYNALAAVAVSVSMNISADIIKESMENFQSAPGRMEKVGAEGVGISVFVDYAHTDDALCNVLQALNEVKEKRIITVFGCGGDRDREKRPRMGKTASLLSDFVVITSDNPRNEAPEDIIQDIVPGLRKGFNDYKIIINRKEAIEYCLKIAKPGDIVLIAGKGHENYQIFKDSVISFDDKKVVMDTLDKLSIAESV